MPVQVPLMILWYTKIGDVSLSDLDAMCCGERQVEGQPQRALMLPNATRRRIQNFVFKEDKVRALLSEVLQRAAIRDYFSCNPHHLPVPPFSLGQLKQLQRREQLRAPLQKGDTVYAASIEDALPFVNRNISRFFSDDDESTASDTVAGRHEDGTQNLSLDMYSGCCSRVIDRCEISADEPATGSERKASERIKIHEIVIHRTKENKPYPAFVAGVSQSSRNCGTVNHRASAKNEVVAPNNKGKLVSVFEKCGDKTAWGKQTCISSHRLASEKLEIVAEDKLGTRNATKAPAIGTWNFNVSHHGQFVAIASHPYLLVG